MEILIIILVFLLLWYFVFPIIRSVRSFRRTLDELRSTMSGAGNRQHGSGNTGQQKKRGAKYKGAQEAEYADFEDVPGKMEAADDSTDDSSFTQEPIVTDAEFEELPPDGYDNNE